MPASTQLGSWNTTTSPGADPLGPQRRRPASGPPGRRRRTCPRHGWTLECTRKSTPAHLGQAAGHHRRRACRRSTSPRPRSARPGRSGTERRRQRASGAGAFPHRPPLWRRPRGFAGPGASGPLPVLGESDYHMSVWRLSASARPGPTMRDHGFHPSACVEVVPETADASSFVLDIPPELRPASPTRPGQFCTFRCRIDGQPHLRCYSMSSSPAVDDRAAGHGQASARRRGVQLDDRPLAPATSSRRPVPPGCSAGDGPTATSWPSPAGAASPRCSRC